MRKEEVLSLTDLVYSMANKYKYLCSSVMDFEDLVQDLWLIVLSAYDKFDVKKGVKFITYAYVAIVNEVKTLFLKRQEEGRYIRECELVKDSEDDGIRGISSFEVLCKDVSDVYERIFLKEIMEKLSLRALLVLVEILNDGEVVRDVSKYWKKLEERLGIPLGDVYYEIKEVLEGKR